MGIVHVIDVIQDIRQQLDTHHVWLRDKTVLREIGQWVEITMPYLDRHNDYVQIYAKQANGGSLSSRTVTATAICLRRLGHRSCLIYFEDP